jgi:nitroreductase/dihydropteridine reductase
LMPLGYRDEAGDWLLSMSKVRKSRDTIVTEVK